MSTTPPRQTPLETPNSHFFNSFVHGQKEARNPSKLVKGKGRALPDSKTGWFSELLAEGYGLEGHEYQRGEGWTYSPHDDVSVFQPFGQEAGTSTYGNNQEPLFLPETGQDENMASPPRTPSDHYQTQPEYSNVFQPGGQQVLSQYKPGGVLIFFADAGFQGLDRPASRRPQDFEQYSSVFQPGSQ